MKILVIGDANSIFIKSHIKNVLDNPNDQIVLATHDSSRNTYNEFYSQKNIKVEEFVRTGPFRKIPRIRTIIGSKLWGKMLKKKYGQFDLIHIHSLSVHSGNIALAAMSKNTAVIITVWGSELLRASEKGLKKLRKYYDAATLVNLLNKTMMDTFLKKYPNFPKEKCKNIDFGNENITAIDNIYSQYSKNELRKEFDINPNDTVIAIGYNRNPAHRHVAVMDELLKLPQKTQKSISIILMLTYGPKDQQYLDELDKRIEKFQGECIKIENYLFGEELAKIVCLLDVFVHAQTTDACSATVMECLYANKILLNGKWLHYDYFDELNINCVEFEMENLYDKLFDVLSNIDEYKNKFYYHDVLKERMDWKKVSSSWKDIYNTAITKAQSNR